MIDVEKLSLEEVYENVRMTWGSRKNDIIRFIELVSELDVVKPFKFEHDKVVAYDKKKFGLNFKEELQVDFWNDKMMLICDENKNVLFGNMFYDKLKKAPGIYTIPRHQMTVDVLSVMEQHLSEDNSQGRLNELFNETIKLIKTYGKQIEQFGLFEFTKEDRFITVDNYIRPPAYNFKKHKKKKGDEEDANIFSGLGGEWDGSDIE